jgi:hypothetical protein
VLGFGSHPGNRLEEINTTRSRPGRMPTEPGDLTPLYREVPDQGIDASLERDPWSQASGGRARHRSADLTLFRRALYQLSYPTG